MRFAFLLSLAPLAPLLACGSTPAPEPASPTAPSSSLGGDASQPVTSHGMVGALKDAPLVATKAHAVSVEGTRVADTPAVVAPAKKPARVDGLFRALQARAGTWKAAHPGEPARAAFTFEGEELASVVKSVIVTAAEAGYPRGALLVRAPSPSKGGLAAGYLEVDVRTEEAPKGQRELHVNLSARGVVLLKWQEDGKKLGDVVASDVQIAKLAADVERGWNERGTHREPNDRRFDQAVLHVDNDTPYTLLVVTLDALHAPRRKLATGAGEELVPAIHVALVAD